MNETTFDQYRQAYMNFWQEPAKSLPNTHDVVQAALVVPWRAPDAEVDDEP